MNTKYDIIALFSGGLDSILAAKILEEQGLKVKCLHFCSPFFGYAHLLDYWKDTYNLDIEVIDVGEDFAQMLVARPPHGFGKWLNPCVDCKILMLKCARQYMQQFGVTCIASGEVIGQRPMSQRRDTLNIIRRDSGLSDALLRPLSALLLAPTKAELNGLVDRSRLLSISGRGRKEQLKLAKHFGIIDIPTPAGGCRLAEQENASRYAQALLYLQTPDANDFMLAHSGRQYWACVNNEYYWICIGRDEKSNAALQGLVKPQDIVFKLRDFAGPLALARIKKPWTKDIMADAASFVASFAPRAVRSGERVVVELSGNTDINEIEIMPLRITPLAWQEPKWQEIKKSLKSTDKE